MITTRVTDLTRLSVWDNGRAGRSRRAKAQNSPPISADLCWYSREMDTRDEDQETAAAPVTASAGATAAEPAGSAAGRTPSRGRLTPGGRPLTGRSAAALALAAAVLLAAGVLRFGLSALLPAYAYLALLSIPLAVIDVREHRLPDRLTLPSCPVALALLGAAALAHGGSSGGRHYLHALAGLAGCAAFYGVLWLISPASIGLGDVKLAGVLGLYLGWSGLGATMAGLLGGFVLAAVVGMVLIAAGRATRKTHIPFGPFMLAATLAVLLTPALSG